MDEAVVAGEPSFGDIAGEVIDRLEGKITVGYNAVRFDGPFLEEELDRADMFPELTIIDVMVAVRAIDKFVKGKGRHQLATTAKRWGVPLDNAHEAVADCRATWGVFKRLIEERPGVFDRPLDEFLAWQETAARDQQAQIGRWRSNR